MNAAVDSLRTDARVEQLRVPPHAAQAEQSVLGGLMIPGAGKAALLKVQDWLTDRDFYRRDHQLIFRAILDLAGRGQPFDAVTVGEWFDGQGLSEQVANGAYLTEITNLVPSASNIVAYAEIVRDRAQLRALIEFGSGLVNSGFQPEGVEVRDLLADAQRRLSMLAGNPRVGGPKGMKEIGLRWFAELQRRYEGGDELLGLGTPWARFNAITAGLKAGELIVLAGRPSMGKSAIAINIATANALRGKRVMFFNLEMTDESIYNRAVASIMEVPLEWLRKPSGVARNKYGDEIDCWPRVTEGVRRMNEAAMAIDDSPNLTAEQIVVRAKREHLRKPLDLLIVDHLHLMPLPGKTRETVEIGNITRALKSLAKELGIPVLLLSQLNRSVESRVNKRPMMSDLRESGNIEQDADVIVFVYRDDYYAERDGKPSEYPGFIEIIIAKQREGETGRVWVRDRLNVGMVDDYDGPPPISNTPKSEKMRRGVDA